MDIPTEIIHEIFQWLHFTGNSVHQSPWEYAVASRRFYAILTDRGFVIRVLQRSGILKKHDELPARIDHPTNFDLKWDRWPEYCQHVYVDFRFGGLVEISWPIVPSHNLHLKSLPRSIGSLANLHVFCLPYHGLAGIISAEIARIKNLQKLDFSHNRLSSAIPKEIGLLSNLRILVLPFNNLSGSIP
ncbi:hypothetical protein HK100_001033, partial [Physocladia obscura]